MNSIYKIAFVIIFFVIIRKLLTLFNNKNEPTERTNEINHINLDNDFSVEHLDDNGFANVETKVADEKDVEPIIKTKNAFLNPDDDFGTMTKGKVYNSVVYDYDINDNSSKVKMKIITSKKNNP